MTTLRDGWNFTGDVANQLEGNCRKQFGFRTEDKKFFDTIFVSAVIANGNFVNVMGLLLRKVTNYQDYEEVNAFILNSKEYIGLPFSEIGAEKSNELYSEFWKIYEKYIK